MDWGYSKECSMQNHEEEIVPLSSKELRRFLIRGYVLVGDP